MLKVRHPASLLYRVAISLALLCLQLSITEPAAIGQSPEDDQAARIARVKAAIAKAVDVFAREASAHGGYVYQVSLDGKTRLGEGKATPTEIWVQPPGTPAVALAMLQAYQVTRDPRLRQPIVAAADALVYGQLESGGWSDRVDFDPAGKRADRYRNGKGKKKGKNYSTLDDDKTQAALRFLIEFDASVQGKYEPVHQAVTFALDSLLKAQFPSGGFPQGWQAPVEQTPVVKANYPSHDWRTEGRIKEYWDYATLNDGLAGSVSKTLWLAYERYQDQRYRDALVKLGDFLILAQMPEPQPAWAQQYNHQMQPMWARKFEPAAISGIESEDALRTLMFIYEKTGEARFLKPIPAALAWLKRSRLPDGQMARFYELQTNRPLYMVKDEYTLTYEDSNLPTHYGFKTKSTVEQLERQYQELISGVKPEAKPASLRSLSRDADKLLEQMDAQGRWVCDKDRNVLADPDQADPKNSYLDSMVFSKSLQRLTEYLQVAQQASSTTSSNNR